MSKNDITNDTLISKPNTKAFEENFDRIFGRKACAHDWCFDSEEADGSAAYFGCSLCGEERTAWKKPPHTCLFCGAPSWYDPSDQSPPPDYCHESDHGEPD